MLWIPAVIALLIQIVLFLSSQPEITIDSADYMAQAESLAATGAALNAKGEADTKRTPGYPLFLAAFLESGRGYPGAIAAQRLLWILAVAATTLITHRLTLNTTAAVVAGAITAIDLPALQATNSILTETLASVGVGAAVWQTYRSASAATHSSAALAGLLAGGVALVRPVAIALGAALALAILIAAPRSHRFRSATVLLVVSLAVPALWVARNYALTGVVTFSSISSINLLLFRAAGTLAIRDPGGVDANIQRRQAELEGRACRAAETKFGRDCESIPLAQRATVYRGIAMPIILADPAAALLQAGRAFVMIMFGGGASMLSAIAGVTESTARTIALAYTLPLALLAALGVAYWRQVDRLAAAVMLMTIVYLVAMSLGVEAYSRFRVPFLPLYAMLAGGGAAALAKRWTRRIPVSN